ncbi:MAG: leucyl aminopeptidase [Gammaproteobacteria bacterium]|nr:MAG: leucyl aminopeptidase [Pseudomonadota bacterium]PIE38128.1 MAG: leucyl aminopeptidase [Gammaproteobacteria bacterium]
MNYKIAKTISAKANIDCLVLGVLKQELVSDLGKITDKALGGLLSRALDYGDIKSAAGSTQLVALPENQPIKRVLLVSNGDQKEVSRQDIHKTLTGCFSALKDINAKKITLPLSEFLSGDQSSSRMIRKMVEIAESSIYRFEDFKSEKAPSIKLKEARILIGSNDNTAEASQALKTGLATANAISLTKNLGNLPGNVCTPSYLAQKARELSEKYRHIKTTVIEEKEMAKLGMGALLSVSAGSRQPAKLIIMEYKGGKAKDKPHVLLGKGITFDSGGISLKPGEAMDEMKYDMCGAATVFGVMQAMAELKPELNITGMVSSAENMPGGKASKPGDIVTTMSGQTVEILNTDAEGRLVLCDALTYAGKFKPASVVDIATLTGACIIALGNQATGLMSNNDDLADELLTAGQNTADRAWRLPIWDEYQTQLDSNFADMQNIGGRPAGSITAACFLSRFCKQFPWAHLDIAGTAWHSGKAKGATGRPAGLLVEYLLNKLETR